MNEFILVKFEEVREVILDTHPSGYNTGEVIEVAPGTHTVSLAGQQNYTPAQQDVSPVGTTQFKPYPVTFSKV